MRHSTQLSGVALCAASFLLIACSASAPDYSLDDPGVVLPGSWAASPEARAGVDSQWIDRFKDPALQRLVAVAVANNKNLNAAAARVERAGANVRVADSALKPSSSFGLQQRREKRNFIGFPFGGDGERDGVASTIFESYNLTLSADWEIDLWGRLRAGKSAAIADLQAESLSYRAARASLIAQVARSYFAAVEAREQKRLAQEAIDILRDAESAIRDRYESALSEEGGTAAQLRLALTDIATARATLAEREGAELQALRTLEILLGQYPEGALKVSNRLLPLPSRPPAGLPSGLLLRRPDILSAERRYASATARIQEAKLAKFPQLQITGNVGTSTDSLSDVLKSDFGVWSLGGQILQPILLNGRTQAEIAIRESSQEELLAQLQATVLESFGEVEDALAAERDLAKRHNAIKDALGLARDAATSAEIDYRDGTGDVLTLLQAKNQRISVESQNVLLQRLRLVNRVELHLALGGDYRIHSK